MGPSLRSSRGGVPICRADRPAPPLISHPDTIPLLKSLDWLPVHLRIHYKILSLCYKSLNNSAPIYLSNSLHLYTPSRHLRSASDPLRLQTPHTKLSTFGPRSFSAYGPHIWNTLPLSLRLKPSLSSFQSALKTYLYQNF